MKRGGARETQDGETPEGCSAFQARAFWKSASNAEESSRTIVASHNSSVSSSLSGSSGSSPSAGCSAGSHPCGAPCDVFVESKCQAPFGIQFRPLARFAEVTELPLCQPISASDYIVPHRRTRGAHTIHTGRWNCHQYTIAPNLEMLPCPVSSRRQQAHTVSEDACYTAPAHITMAGDRARKEPDV